MGGASLPPAAMPPVPLSHSQSGLAHASSHSAHVDASRRHTPTMTALPKPAAPDASEVPMAPLSLAPLSQPTADPTPSAEDAKPLKKHHSKKKKKRGSVSELTPLILKGQSGKTSSEEEVHPLPWFRSPEWTRKSPLLNTNDKRRKPSGFRRGRLSHEQTSLCNSILSTVCCGLGASAENDVDLELGTRRSDSEQLESEGFKQCVQFLVGLIVVVAIALIVMIIFQPFQQDASLW